VTGLSSPQATEARLQALLSSLDDLVFELDADGTYLGVWTTDAALLVAPKDELIGRTVRDAIGDEIGVRLIEVIRHVLGTGSPEIFEYRLDVPAGVRWFQGRVAPIEDAGNHPSAVCLLVRDITVQKVAEEEITKSLAREQLLSRLSDALPLGLFQIDTDARITFTNDRLHTILGDVPAATLEEQLSSVVEEDRSVLESAIASVLADRPVDDIEIRLRAPALESSPAAAERVCLLSLRALTDTAGVVSGAVGCLSDVTDRVQLRRELEVRASVDELTRCMNRAATLDVLGRATVASTAAGKGIAVVFLDLDQFKSVNDRYGHGAGDRLLAATADCLRSAVRDRDDVGRLGGDEFLVICPEVETPELAVRIGERIAAAVRTTVDLGPAVVDLHASIGVAWTNEPLGSDAFIAQADTAMYTSKRAGRRGVSLFTPARAEAD